MSQHHNLVFQQIDFSATRFHGSGDNIRLLPSIAYDYDVALIDYWATDWDYDSKTFCSMWQAIRGNGKQASTVVTMAAIPELPAGKRVIAVRLVDVFGNDASATVEVK